MFFRPKVEGINHGSVTRRAKKDMIDVHSQKYLKAWIDKTQYAEKARDLQKDYNLLSDEMKEKVEEYVNKRLNNPSGEMIPDAEIAQAVTTKMGLDTMYQEVKRAEMEFQFFDEVIQKLKTL